MQNRKLKICLIGFGNAGKEFCRMIIQKNEEILLQYGYDILVTGIATRSRGALINHSGINLKRALEEVSEHGKFSTDNPEYCEKSSLEMISASHADVMIELSTLSIHDGQPAISHIEEAFNNNMDAITANKGPIAWDYKRLSSIAKSKKLNLLHETTVMDGTPVFNLVRETLPGCRILGFRGILNSTTNFILEEMEKGNTYDEAVKEAQKRGFAEADPSMDVDGWDPAAKTAALINVLMNGEVNPNTIERKGIGDISYEDIKRAREDNKKIKVICEGYLENGTARGRVYPELVDMSDVFSTIDSTTSIVSIKTDLMGVVDIIERDPEIQQTAYGIYSDMLTLIRRKM